MRDSDNDCAKCDKVLTAQIQKVACGSDCRECGRYSYLPSQPAYLYLLTNPDLEEHRIGIGSVARDKNRIQELISQGWIAHGLWHDENKRRTFQWEREIFKQLQNRVVTAGPETPYILGKSDRHWVETVSAKSISAAELATLISEIVLKIKRAAS